MVLKKFDPSKVACGFRGNWGTASKPAVHEGNYLRAIECYYRPDHPAPTAQPGNRTVMDAGRSIRARVSFGNPATVVATGPLSATEDEDRLVVPAVYDVYETNPNDHRHPAKRDPRFALSPQVGADFVQYAYGYAWGMEDAIGEVWERERVESGIPEDQLPVSNFTIASSRVRVRSNASLNGRTIGGVVSGMKASSYNSRGMLQLLPQVATEHSTTDDAYYPGAGGDSVGRMYDYERRAHNKDAVDAIAQNGTFEGGAEIPWEVSQSTASIYANSKNYPAARKSKEFGIALPPHDEEQLVYAPVVYNKTTGPYGRTALQKQPLDADANVTEAQRGYIAGRLAALDGANNDWSRVEEDSKDHPGSMDPLWVSNQSSPELVENPGFLKPRTKRKGPTPGERVQEALAAEVLAAKSLDDALVDELLPTGRSSAPEVQQPRATEPAPPPQRGTEVDQSEIMRSLDEEQEEAAEKARRMAEKRERRRDNIKEAIEDADKSRGKRCKVIARKFGYRVKSCGGANFQAFDKDGKEVGNISVYELGYQTPDGRPIVKVGSSWTAESTRGLKVGTALYEAVAEHLCKEGKVLGSDTTRSRYSEAFWAKQRKKGRGICMTDPLPTAQLVTLIKNDPTLERKAIETFAEKHWGEIPGAVESSAESTYYSGPWANTKTAYANKMAAAKTAGEKLDLRNELEKLDNHLPQPPDTGVWPCGRWRLDGDKVCGKDNKKEIDLGKLPKRRKRCPPGYRKHTTRTGNAMCKRVRSRP